MTEQTTIEYPVLPIQAEEVEILQPRDSLTVSQWAEKRRKLSKLTSNYDGDWSNKYTPFLIEIMDALSDAITRQVTLQKCSQSGGTEAGLNFVGRTIEEDPGPMLIVMPTEKDTNRRMNTGLKPMFKSTMTLRKYLPGGKVDNLNIGKETVLENIILYIGWAGSATALADNTVRYVILDEVGKFPASAGEESDPISLARDRMRTYSHRSKMYCPSTPVLKDDLFDREYKDGDMRQWWSKCPHCGDRHVLKWENVSLDKTEDGKLLTPKEYENGGHARYVCPKCAVLWTEQERWKAVLAGKWAPDGCEVETDGSITGEAAISKHKSYHMNSLMLYPGFQTVDVLAAAWAKAQIAKHLGDIKPLQNFINSELGEPFEDRKKITAEDVVRRHKGNYPENIVPRGVQMIIITADVQLDHFWVSVDGYGYLSEVWDIYTGRIEAGGDTKYLENWDPLRKFLSSSFIIADQNPPPGVKPRVMTAYMCGVDCNYQMQVALDFCSQCKELNIVPVRGDAHVRNQVFRSKKIEGGWTIRYDLNVDRIKDRIFYQLYENDVPGSGYWHLNADTTEDTISQLASEHQKTVRAGNRTETIWVPKDSHRPNHIWDCKVYSSFVAELAGARALPDPDKVVTQVRRVGRVQRR